MRAQRSEADQRFTGRPVPPAPSAPIARRRDSASPGDVRSPAGILRLQRSIGNRAVGSLLRAGQAGRSIQRFPFAFSERNGLLRLSGRLEWPYLNLYSHGVEIGYIKVSTRDDGRGGQILELKHIQVLDPGSRGGGLGTVLIYLFGELAVAGNFASVAVLLANGQGLYARTGFVVTPNADNPANPPAITGVPATVRNTARGLLAGRFLIVDGPPPPVPAPAQARGRNTSLNNTGEGNRAIGNDDL